MIRRCFPNQCKIHKHEFESEILVFMLFISKSKQKLIDRPWVEHLTENKAKWQVLAGNWIRIYIVFKSTQIIVFLLFSEDEKQKAAALAAAAAAAATAAEPNKESSVKDEHAHH